MRQPEPFAGYDAMAVDELLAAIETADMATIKKVRSYERKFANRALVTESVTRVHPRARRGRARRPAARLSGERRSVDFEDESRKQPAA